MNLKKTMAVVAALMAVLNARAQFETYFGEEVSPYPVDGINQIARPGNLDSVWQAKAKFYARLTGVVTESFEGFGNGSAPDTLLFGTNTAHISTATPGSYSILVVPEATNTLNGVFPSSGAKCLLFSSPSGTTSFTLAFSSPQAAFGFFGTDVEVNLLTLTLIATNGTRRVVHPAITVPQGTGGAFFFGVIDQSDLFSGIEFSNSGTLDDAFGFDDMVIAAPGQVLVRPLLGIASAPAGQVELSWDTVANQRYQLETNSSLNSDGWTSFGPAMPGNGLRMRINDSVVGAAQRYYRVAVTNAF